MSTRLMVTPKELETIAAQFRQIAADQEVLTQNTQALLNVLNNAWQGESATAFTVKLHTLIHDEQEKIQLLNALAIEISKAGEQMMACDAKMASQIASAFSS